jgi:hypothetical protein
LEFHPNELYKCSILDLRIQGRFAVEGLKSMFRKVCSERAFLPNPQGHVEKLWIWILFLMKEAISTILPKK